MNNLFRSAILKLTLFYMVIVMAISLVFSAVIYRTATVEVATGLHNQTLRIYRQYPVFDQDPFFTRETDLHLSERHLLLNLIYVNVAVLAVAGLASYWLARRTLAPIAAANEQQKRFVADASHELRTPLTALKMETEVALMDEQADKQALREALSSNLEEAVKLETLLNDLLRLSRLESDELEQTFVTVDLAAIVSTALERTKRLADAKHIHIEQHVQDTPAVLGDQESLVQLAVILVDNAIKYSPAKGTILVRTLSKAGRVNLSITDHGPGIKPESLEHVFDRFYRAESSRTTAGYGLGLAIAKHIADLHHATITLKSTIGKGTTAVVSLSAATPQ